MQGIICNGQYPAALTLSGKGLTGNIPFEISQLNGMTSMDFSFNSLSGMLPVSTTQLVTLQVSARSLRIPPMVLILGL